MCKIGIQVLRTRRGILLELYSFLVLGLDIAEFRFVEEITTLDINVKEGGGWEIVPKSPKVELEHKSERKVQL